MSNPVTRYYVDYRGGLLADRNRADQAIFTEELVVLASAYAALEQERDRLQRDLAAAREALDKTADALSIMIGWAQDGDVPNALAIELKYEVVRSARVVSKSHPQPASGDGKVDAESKSGL